MESPNQFDIETIVSLLAGKHISHVAKNEYHRMCGHLLSKMANQAGDTPRNTSDDDALARYGLILQNPKLYKVIYHVEKNGLNWKEYLTAAMKAVKDSSADLDGTVKLTGGDHIEIEPCGPNLCTALMNVRKDIRRDVLKDMHYDVDLPKDIIFPLPSRIDQLQKQIIEVSRTKLSDSAETTAEVTLEHFGGLDNAQAIQKSLSALLIKARIPFKFEKIVVGKKFVTEKNALVNLRQDGRGVECLGIRSTNDMGLEKAMSILIPQQAGEYLVFNPVLPANISSDNLICMDIAALDKNMVAQATIGETPRHLLGH